MNKRALFNWILVLAGFVLPLVVLALWARFELGLGTDSPASVVRIALPDGSQQIGLPKVLGPADSSRPLVVIDAGHGGHDPGASGENGLQEKTLTLSLALALRDALVQQGGVRVALTRDSDRFLVLQERSGIAQRLGADLFVSIHADAAESTEAGGATVYTLSDRGSDAVADQVAARENRVDTINGVPLDGRSNAVSSILVDLSQRAMRERSLDLSTLILREGNGRFRFHKDPQREAAFVVLKSLDLPSILIEAGYVSNPDDARSMRDRRWRSAFASAVAQAITIELARQETPSPTP
jgi:N-acetylmuramoyl-L-alanine amidase